jgi:glycerol-3-phosphate dehydrogenase
MRRRKNIFKRTLGRFTRGVTRQIDFIRLLAWLGRFETGRNYTRQHPAPQPPFLDQDDIIEHAVDLTTAALAEQGDDTGREQIQEYAQHIGCRYDPEIHQIARSGLATLFGHLFEHPNPNMWFISPDRRELRHFDRVREAREQGLGVLYLVNHSSHVDEFILDFALDRLGISQPLFAAGDNMMATPSLERLLRIGSYVVARRGASKAYFATLFNYCRALSEMGHQQGIFLEAWSGGARTRDGSLRYPRRLVTLQGALATDRDVLVQPVVLSYSAVPEDLSLSERAGVRCWVNGLNFFRHFIRNPIRPGRALARGSDKLYGRSFVTFCRPKRLSELRDMWKADRSELALDEFVALDSMREIAKDKKVMASHLTARAVVRARENGGSLIDAARAEMDDLVEFHQETFGNEPDFEDFILDNPLKDVIKDGKRTLKRRKILGGRDLRSGRVKVNREVALQYYATHADHRLYSPSAKENMVVYGAGPVGYGLACLVGRHILDRKRHNTSSLTLYDVRRDLVTELVYTRNHPEQPQTGIRLPKNVFNSSDRTAAFRKATEVILTSPLDFFETDLRGLLSSAHQPLNLIIATRGFERSDYRLPVQIARDICREMGRFDVKLFALSGPGMPRSFGPLEGGALVLAGPLAEAEVLADMFRLEGYGVRVCDDPLGVQLAGALIEVYTLLGTYLLRSKEIKGRAQVAGFMWETSREAMWLARALGARTETFLPDNPAWTAEYVAAGMGGPAASFGRWASRSLSKAQNLDLDSLQNEDRGSRDQDGRLMGYIGIRAAYHLAHQHDLDLPRLRQAYGLFWKT